MEVIRLLLARKRYSLFFLGRRTLESFRDFGVLPAFAGVVVSDWYVNYFHEGWEHIAGNRRAWPVQYATTRTRPSATRPRSGQCRRSGRCAS
jgi:hypothetical protein